MAFVVERCGRSCGGQASAPSEPLGPLRGDHAPTTLRVADVVPARVEFSRRHPRLGVIGVARELPLAHDHPGTPNLALLNDVSAVTTARRQLSYRHVAGGGFCVAHTTPLRARLNVSKLAQKVSSPT